MIGSLNSFHNELDRITLEKAASFKGMGRGAVIGGGIGAVLGGIAGYAGGGDKKKPTPKDRREAAIYAALSGGITGALLGAAAGGMGPMKDRGSTSRPRRGPGTWTRQRNERRAEWSRARRAQQEQWDRDWSRIRREAREARERARRGRGGEEWREQARRERARGGGQRQRGQRRDADRSVRFHQRAGPKPDWMGDVKSKDEAKKKWRKKVRGVHPDRAQSTKQRQDFEEKAKKINAEWDAWKAGRTYKNLKTKISATLALRGMDADSFGFLTGRRL